MEIQRASRLGQLHEKLGIDPNSRISYQLTDEGVIVWDLATETRFSVSMNPPNVTTHRFQVPALVKAVIASSDEQLQQRFSKSWEHGWSDERQTIFTELAFRGVKVL